MFDRIDKKLFVTIIIILIFGLIIFGSAALGVLSSNEAKFYSVIKTQLIYALIGGTIALIMGVSISYKFYEKYAYILFGIALFFTSLVFVPGLSRYHGGAHRWIDIGSFSLQPSEALKLAFVIVVAAWCTKYRSLFKNWKYGLMPYLIALGAMLGNKNNITPMLKYRDSGQWCWPLEKPIGSFYSINGLEDLADSENEVLITLALTAEPESLIRARQEIAESIGAKHIIIKAYPEYMGNGALGHPDDGCAFTSSVQGLMHFLKDKKSVNKIHLFPCASNAACVFFGQAFDSHHADMLVYDFCEQSMKPILLIANSENRCVINQV